MKKMLALMLALCMMLAALPALAETDFTGTWYMLMSGVTCAAFELNADGTCAASSAVSGEKTLTSGTWSADGDEVTITLFEQPLTLAFDGTDLTLKTEEGADLLLKFSRQPGEASLEDLTAFAEKGTVPEGKTKEEMEKVLEQMGGLFFKAVEAAVTEEAYGGTWYLTMTGITLGTFELNADGTVAAVSGEKKLEGTWAAEEDVLNITISGQPLYLYFDGTDLLVYDADTPELASLLKFSRQSGITVDELKAFTADGTVPEGKTKEDMENVQNQLGLLYVVASLLK